MYRQRLHYFDYKFTDETLMYNFENFIYNNVKELFSNAEYLNTRISVSYVQAKAITNKQGAYVETLKSLANTIHMDSSNTSQGYRRKNYHQQAIFSVILTEATSFQKLINLIDEYLANLVKGSFEWNVVYYSYYDALTGGIQ